MKAYELIDSPEKWTQGAYIRYDGAICASEAIKRAYGSYTGTPEYNRVAHYVGKFVCEWNDESTWETVYNTLKELDV